MVVAVVVAVRGRKRGKWKEQEEGCPVLHASHEGCRLVVEWAACQPCLHCVLWPRLCLLWGPPPPLSHKGPV